MGNPPFIQSDNAPTYPANPAERDFSGANAPPTVPISPVLNTAQDQNAPAPEVKPAPGSFSAKLGDALASAKTDPATPALLASPGGWAKLMLASTLHALTPSSPNTTAQSVTNGINSFFAPMAGGPGALGGAGDAAKAALDRQAANQKTKFDQNAETQRLAMEEQRTKIANAASNAQMLHSQMLIHQLGEQELDSNIASSKQTLATLEKAPQPAPIIAEGITSDELHSMLAQGTFDPSTQTPYLTGKKFVKEDENGVPQYRGTYTIVGVPKEVRITDQSEADELFGKGKVTVDADHPMILPGSQYNFQVQQAENNRAATAAAQKAADETALANGERAQKVEAMNFAGSGLWVNALSAAMRPNPKTGQAPTVAEAHLRALQALAQNPDILKKYPTLTKDVREQVGEKLWDSMVDEQQKAADKLREEAQKKQAQITSSLTGDDFLQTLPTAQQSTVRAIGEGRQLLPANRKEALALLEQVHQAYPDFDESKVKTWQKANNEYRGSGKTATQIVPAYNTALSHMQDLFSNTTPEGVFNPLSKAYQDREVALGYVSREVGKAVSAGAMTQKESEDLLSTLKGGLTPALKRERIAKTAQLLHDKIDEYQTKFSESAPSSAVKVPILLSPKAAQSYDFIQSGGQQPQPKSQAPLTNLQSNGKVTIGWNGTQWVDSKTGQPYTGAQ